VARDSLLTCSHSPWVANMGYIFWWFANYQKLRTTSLNKIITSRKELIFFLQSFKSHRVQIIAWEDCKRKHYNLSKFLLFYYLCIAVPVVLQLECEMIVWHELQNKLKRTTVLQNHVYVT